MFHSFNMKHTQKFTDTFFQSVDGLPLHRGRNESKDTLEGFPKIS